MIRRFIRLGVECTYGYRFAITSTIDNIFLKVLPRRILGGYMSSGGREYLEVLNLCGYVDNAMIDASLDVFVVSDRGLVAEGSIRLLVVGGGVGLLVEVIVNYLRILILFILFLLNLRVLLV